MKGILRKQNLELVCQKNELNMHAKKKTHKKQVNEGHNGFSNTQTRIRACIELPLRILKENLFPANLEVLIASCVCVETKSIKKMMQNKF